ncbi:GDP-Man:Man3GlcNAc2-PP-dolichol alpha-1,2-mannosyltransferase [Malassezia vespertilionis]|uniref:GDP-Man:Man(3)GlcNAc(2)-PP-Dol alpha-1,2-mannosyltransferase n=1 Tax=Malassezia vespertilionis TaxID=2020962 RepID=A0A2N1J9B3_9BASI|nr:GDP-Man:Man3GlcNAc2-PP-dolichol alpha-1,2-mannosyltransferase [Malassezia vespertilionis]PKI83147.1 Alg11p [Malassezia vespertilionis]WFD07653.1 GDP-Man:Man3GlcNAc2-PP-dolichol alpha-1,2-mannosyltransferase [Malassezia vespertilionis]
MEVVLRFGFIFSFAITFMYYISRFAWRRALRDTNKQKRARILVSLGIREPGKYMFVGFLHPYCNGGGGGERVLFEAISTLQNDANIISVVYTGDIEPLPDGVSKAEILAKCKERFGITLREDLVAFLPLRNRYLVDGSYWRYFTLLGQAFGSNRITYEALGMMVPDVFIDSVGYGFSMRAVKNFSSKIRVGTYIHYPMISSDMQRRVRSRSSGLTNSSRIADSILLSGIKSVYYLILSTFYGRALRAADCIAVNGTWTHNHVQELMRHTVPRPWTPYVPPVHIVYPPCDTEQLARLPLDSRQLCSIVSLAQFRPEKDHEMQLRVVHRLLTENAFLRRAQGDRRPLMLTMIGGCRNKEDRARVDSLQMLAKELGIERNVEWCIDAPRTLVLEKLRRASIGLSTMVDEHFGINVVEYMAAGLLTLSNASAGPLLDIAVPVDGEVTGFHAKQLETYVEQAYKLLTMPEVDAFLIRERARKHVVNTFSDQHFCSAWKTKFWDWLVPPTLLQLNEERIQEIKEERAQKALAQVQRAKEREVRRIAAEAKKQV